VKRTVELLLAGDRRVAEGYAFARRAWKDLLDTLERGHERQLHLEQRRFEQACGEVLLGKEAMGVAAAALLASIEEPRQRALTKSVLGAMTLCSVEVKWAFWHAARLYDLDLGEWRP